MLRGWGALYRRSLILLGLLCASAPAFGYYDMKKPTVDYEDLVALIEQYRLTSVEATLAVLKEQQPELFNNVVLMYRSKSLQRANFLEPRALLFDRSGSIVITFNGDKKDSQGYDKLEVMQFRERENKFEFREISFYPGKSVQFSGPNPAKCLQCHQSASRKTIDPRPNWEPYNNWPGAYGSNNGGWDKFRSDQLAVFEAQDRQHLEDQAREQEMLKKFIREVKPQHPRYKHIGFNNLSAPGPANPTYEEQVAEARQFEKLLRGTKDLTQFLGVLNSRRVMRLMKEDAPAQWDYLKYAVAGISKCNKLFISEKDYAEINQSAPQEFLYRESRQIVTTSDEALVQRFRSNLYSQRYPLENIEELVETYRQSLKAKPKYLSQKPTLALWTLFEPLGISIQDWSMDFQTQGRMAFYERFGLPTNFQSALKQTADLMIPELMKLTCEELEQKSVEAYSQYKTTALYRETLLARETELFRREPLINRCISCHGGSARDFGAPHIPFENEAELRKALKSNASNGNNLLEEIKYRLSDHATLQDQMPRSLARPSREERVALVRYLESLN